VSLLTLNSLFGAAGGRLLASDVLRQIGLEIAIVQVEADLQDQTSEQLTGPAAEVAARIRQLEAKGQIVVLDRIRITTMENQATMVQSGRTVNIASGQQSFGGRGGPGQMSYQQQQVGTLVSATATVNGDAVLLELQVEKSHLPPAVAAVKGEPAPPPTGPETLTCQVTARIENAQIRERGPAGRRRGGDCLGAQASLRAAP
jgi:type II secretory pathway component GspD/PulD (secretin)